MKYIKIKDKQLLEVLGEKARKMKSIGLQILPQHQMMDNKNKVSYGVIFDEELFNQANIKDESITIFDTKEEVNADIDLEYGHYFMITDIEKLKLDIELSGGITAIEGYDPNKSLDSQENLQALLQRDMAGIGINRKNKLFYLIRRQFL